MYIGKTSTGFDMPLDLKARHNANNLLLCLGDSGNGKTTLLRNLATGVNKDGVPVIIPDYSESYIKSEVKGWDNLDYFNIITAGLPVDIFKPRVLAYDDEVRVEDEAKVASRITGLLVNSFNITGGVERPVLASAVKEHMRSSEKIKSFAGIISELKKIESKQAGNLVCKLEILTEIPISDKSIDWDEIVGSNRIAVFQMSFLDERLRKICLELLLADLWEWVRKRDNRKEIFLVLDEISNFSFKSPYFLSHVREFRKFGIGAVMATQYLGGLKGKDATNLLNQAAIRTYFCIRDTKEGIRVAKEIDYENYKKWVPIIRNLRIGECVFCGNILYEGEVLEQKVVVRVPYNG